MALSPGQLPPHPCLDQSRNQARELLRTFKAGDATALARVRQHHPRLAGAPDQALNGGRFTLSDAQLVIAREAGLPSWARLKRQIEWITGPDRCRPFVREVQYYDDRARGLLSVHETGQRQALGILRRYHPRFSGAPDAEIRDAALTLDDARLVFAHEHGFLSWEAFTRHVEALARCEAAEPFMEAFEAIRAGDRQRLEGLLDQHPDLVNARGTNGNRLLHLATSMRKVELAKLLLGPKGHPGADPDARNNKGWTPLHDAAYGDPDCEGGASVQLLRMLLDAGASIDLSAHGDGGTPLVQALFWGHRPQAEILAERGIVPRNLRVAAALGRLDLVRSVFTRDGRLKPQAGAHREFHRPHSGFPAWKPSDDPQEILDEALVWAAKNGRTEAMGFLLERGADVNGDPYRGTALLWAASKGHAHVAAWLLNHGAEVNRRATFGGPQHGQGVTALHLAAENGNMEMVRFLVEHGADPTIEDEIYHSTPAGWAEHFGHHAARNYLLRSQ
jgi:ankyrin repeat protein